MPRLRADMGVGIRDETQAVSVGQVVWGLRATEWTLAFYLVMGPTTAEQN